MDGLAHSWPHLMWTPEIQGRDLLCCSHHWCSCTRPVSGPVFLLSRGDYSCPCHRADELLMTVISFAQCCSVTLCGQGALGTRLLLPVFPHLLVKKAVSGFPPFTQHRHTSYFTWALALHWHLPKGLQRGVQPRARLCSLCWISHVICACHPLLLMVNEWLSRMLWCF